MNKTIITLLAVLFMSSTALSQVRPYDKTGINGFETKKENLAKFDKLI